MSHVLANDHIQLSSAPAVPGLIFRRFRGESDYPAMVEVVAASARADKIERVDNVERVAQTYANLKNCNPATDMIFAEVNGEVIGYCRGWWEHEVAGAHSYRHVGFLKPAWRRKGIGSAMLGFIQRRLCEIAAAHPHSEPSHLQGLAGDGEEGAHHLLRNDGYAPVTYDAIMVRPDLDAIPDLGLPEGVEVRPVTPEQYRSIWEAEREAFLDHWGDSPMTEEDYQMFLYGAREFDPSLWRVAWQGDQVVGMVRSFVNEAENAEFKRRRGWTENISVRKPWRRLGIARALIALSLQAIKERGMQEAALGVHTENPNGAFQLYESMGFRVVKTQTFYRKPLEL